MVEWYKWITCSEKVTVLSPPLVATFPAIVFASVSRIILQLRCHRSEIWVHMNSKRKIQSKWEASHPHHTKYEEVFSCLNNHNHNKEAGEVYHLFSYTKIIITIDILKVARLKIIMIYINGFTIDHGYQTCKIKQKFS